MEPFEIMTSESQERMLAICEPEQARRPARHLPRSGRSRASVIGTVTGIGSASASSTGSTARCSPTSRPRRSTPTRRSTTGPSPEPADRAARSADRGRRSPAPDRRRRRPARAAHRPHRGCSASTTTSCSSTPSRARAATPPCCGSSTPPRAWTPAAASRSPATATTAGAPSTPGRAPRSWWPRRVMNLACVGARPLGLVNCLNFGNPEHPEVMWQLSEAIDGMARGLPGLRDPGRGRQRQPLQREPRAGHRSHAGRRPGRRSSTGSTGAPRACGSSTAARCSPSVPSRARSPGRAGPGTAGRRGGPAPDLDLDAHRRGGRPGARRWWPTACWPASTTPPTASGVALAEMAVRAGTGFRVAGHGRRPRAGCSPSRRAAWSRACVERPARRRRAGRAVGRCAGDATSASVGGDRLVVAGVARRVASSEATDAWRGRLPERPRRRGGPLDGREPSRWRSAAPALAD